MLHSVLVATGWTNSQAIPGFGLEWIHCSLYLTLPQATPDAASMLHPTDCGKLPSFKTSIYWALVLLTMLLVHPQPTSPQAVSSESGSSSGRRDCFGGSFFLLAPDHRP